MCWDKGLVILFDIVESVVVLTVWGLITIALLCFGGDNDVVATAAVFEFFCGIIMILLLAIGLSIFGCVIICEELLVC